MACWRGEATTRLGLGNRAHGKGHLMNAHALKSVTPRYDPVEDRILLAINAGQDDAWACWLTRRMALGVLGRLNQYLDQTSAMAAKTPLEYRARWWR